MDEDFGQKVRLERDARGWSQGRLAEEAGTTQSTIERIENGRTLRSRFRLEVAHVLGIELRGFPAIRKPNAAAEPADLPMPPLGAGALATAGIPSTGTLHNQAHAETPESQIVREVAEVTVRKVWGYLEHTDPMPDEFFAVVRSSIADYVAQKVRERRRNPMDHRIQTEVEDRKDDKASERG